MHLGCIRGMQRIIEDYESGELEVAIKVSVGKDILHK